MSHSSKRRKVAATAVYSLVSCIAEEVISNDSDERQDSKAVGRKKGAKTIKRIRDPEDKFLHEIDRRLFRRRYRMEYDSFFLLLDILKPYFESKGRKRLRGKDPNGPITEASRLSQALRYFAGGDPLDICQTHNVAPSEPLRSVWIVVDAIHKASQLKIVFPATHFEQLKVAEGFKKKSDVNFDNCVGAIDGIHIWTHKPTKHDVEDLGFGELKFFCGRKLKYGLNMQAACDARGRFLDVYIGTPGAASDFYSFGMSPLKEKLEKEGFLYPGLCLYGDNAYVNTASMAVPYRNVSLQTDKYKDAYNFYQSQVRINIECAFGILVHRWGILRKAIPCNIPVNKTMSLVMALCKLHNFCIGESGDAATTTLAPPSTEDFGNITIREGGLFLPRMDGNTGVWSYSANDRLSDLLDGGDHQEDHRAEDRRARRIYNRGIDMPNAMMLSHVTLNRYTRPS